MFDDASDIRVLNCVDHSMIGQPSEETVRCQKPKPILLSLGEVLSNLYYCTLQNWLKVKLSLCNNFADE